MTRLNLYSLVCVHNFKANESSSRGAVLIFRFFIILDVGMVPLGLNYD